MNKLTRFVISSTSMLIGAFVAYVALSSPIGKEFVNHKNTPYVVGAVLGFAAVSTMSKEK